MRLQQTKFQDEFYDFDGLVSDYTHLFEIGKVFHWGRVTVSPGKKGHLELFSTKKERDVDNRVKKGIQKIYSKSDLKSKQGDTTFYRNFKLKKPLVSIRDQRKTILFRVV